MMDAKGFNEIFTPGVLKKLFPEDRSDQFFDALYGDATEGSYDIRLEFKNHQENRLEFELYLTQRLGQCISCSLTYGLPEVFSRHPVININGLVQEVERLLDGRARCIDWKLGATREISDDIHVVPLGIILDN
ncbi:MAG: pancreas/duodenum homeobox protein 1 [Deltaproteobacteria bacterium]|nr:pancreas/duodenum homeobox protein 1 [Deltaproteobacteria bacterium]